MDRTTPSRRQPARAASAASRAGTPGPTQVTTTATTTSFQAERVISKSRAKTGGSRPSVATGGSQAYGAAGKIGMAGDMSAAGESNTFAQTFSAQRNETAEAARPSQNASRLAVTAQPVISTIAEEVGEPDDSPLARPNVPFRRGNTAAGAGRGFSYNQPPSAHDRASFTYDRLPSRSYATGHEGGMGEEHWHQPPPPPNPSTYEVYRRVIDRSPFYRFLEKFVVGLGVLFFSVVVSYFLSKFMWTRLPESDRAYIKSVLPLKPSATISLPPNMTGEWVLATGYKLSRDFAMNGQQRLLLTEEAVRRLWQSDKARTARIEKLEAELPTMIAVRKNNETGELEIPDQFWQALLSRIEQLSDDLTASATDPTNWYHYLERNKAVVDDILNQKLDKQLKPLIKEMLAELHVVEREAIINYIEQQRQNYDDELMDLRLLMNTSYRWTRAEVVQHASETAERVVTARLDSLALQELNLIASQNLVHNAQIAINKVNYFSARLGARVDPHLTSPTQARNLNWVQKVYSSLIWLPSPHPPIAALEPWDEASDCWCAAATPGNEGKAQLAILMPYPIFPQQVTVEHVPDGGTLDIRSAPKNMELWVEIKDKAKREEVEAIRRATVISGENCSPQKTMGPNYVCLGRWQYRIHAPNHVQTFSLDIQLKHIGLAVQKAIVRVDSNWGREWTCIYRVRMHGELEKPLFEKTTETSIATETSIFTEESD